MNFQRFCSLILFSFFLLYAGYVAASPEPCRYNKIADAYKAAEVAVIGKVMGKAPNGFDLQLQVLKVIKGQSADEITLQGQRPVNTEYNGFSYADGKEVFLLLNKSPNGIYVAVEDFNSGCFANYFVTDGKVTLVEQDAQWNSKEVPVAVDALQSYFVSDSSLQEKTSELCEKYDQAWQSCSQDSDCVSARNVCGFPVAYNKQSLEAAEKYNKCMGPVVSCPQLMNKDPTITPVCKNSICVLPDK